MSEISDKETDQKRMQLYQETASAIEELKQRATLFANIDDRRFLRLDLGPASFEELFFDLKALNQFSKRVVECSWRGVPLEVIRTCSQNFFEIEEPARRIMQFAILQSSNVQNERQNYLLRFKRQWAIIYNYVAPHLCYAESVEGSGNFKESLANFLIEANKLKQDAQAKVAAAIKSAEDEANRIKKVAAGVDEVAKRTLVNNEAIHFKALADRYRFITTLWLVAASAFGVFLFIYVQNFQMPNEKDPFLLAEHLVPRLVAVTLLSTGLIFCIRNFSAFMHNVIVNRHRQTALTTFQTFVSSTADEGTKNAVLVQSTQAIFSPQPSGYLKAETEMPQINQVTEIVRGVTGKDK